VSPLHGALQDYLTVRRGLGYKLEREGRLLPDFVDFVERAGTTTVSAELAVAWARQPLDGHPSWWANRLGMVRGFAAYLETLNAATEVPARSLLPGRSRRATPYLFSDDEVQGLMAAAGALRTPLRAATYATLIGLLAVTGMRVGEAIRLDRADVDLLEGLLTVRDGKFGKSREVALHATTAEALRGYAHRREEECPRPEAPSFFVSIAGTRLFYTSVQHVFARLTVAAGITRRSASCRPRLHDLRHTFAVTTLLGWYRDGVDVEPRLPLLSTYLGHADPGSTYWYLSAAPELFALAAQRLEHALGELP
jgi:integrase